MVVLLKTPVNQRGVCLVLCSVESTIPPGLKYLSCMQFSHWSWNFWNIMELREMCARQKMSEDLTNNVGESGNLALH